MELVIFKDVILLCCCSELELNYIFLPLFARYVCNASFNW